MNGLLTLRGAWHRLRDEPVLKFLVVAITYYGMSTFEATDDVHQVGERRLALHRLDDRPRARGRDRSPEQADIKVLGQQYFPEDVLLFSGGVNRLLNAFD